MGTVSDAAVNGERRGGVSVLVLAQMAPCPLPLTGSQIRIDRIARAIGASFDTSFYCISPVVTEHLRREWDASRRFVDVQSFRRDANADSRDPQWGAPWRSVVGALPWKAPPGHAFHWSAALVHTLRAFREHDPVVFAFRSWMGEMALAAGLRRIIVDVDDIESNIWRAQLSKGKRSRRHLLHVMQLRNLARYEQNLLGRFSRVAITKEQDRQVFADTQSERLLLVPNGVDPVSNPKTAVGANILFIGALGWHPNLTAAHWFAEQVLPIIKRDFPSAHFRVAGRGPLDREWCADMERLGVEVIESPASLEPLYADAAVVVLPLQSGGGTSLKAAEAFSQAIPVVSTQVGVRGFPLTANEHYLLAESAEEFAAACCRAINDPESLRHMVASSKALVDEHFSWARVTEPVVACIDQLSRETP